MTKQIEKYKAMAARLDEEIARKRGPRQTNTPKRALQDKSARIDADHLERVRDACLVLAKSEANGSDWIGALRPIYTKAQLMTMMKTKVDHPSYYALVDTGVFTDTSPEAVKLQSLVAASKDPAAVAEKARQDRIAELIEKVKFSPIPGFFPTPRDVVGRMIEAAQLYGEEMRVLEPSAGIGSIADEIPKRHDLTCLEVNPTLCDILTAKGLYTLRFDFMEWNTGIAGNPTMTTFDRILMNPPFENGQDIDHIRHAYGMLAEGGRLVAIISEGPFYRTDKKAVAFREWLDGKQYEFVPLDEGSFAKPDAFRKTGVKVRMLVIDAPDLP